MKTYLDCIPCFLNQALRAGRIITEDENKLRTILDEVGIILRDIPLERTPPEIGMLVYKKVGELTGEFDPYHNIKKDSTEKALSLYHLLKDEVVKSKDRLLTAIKIAIAGNVIDYGVNRVFNIEEDIDKVLKNDFAIFDYDKFKHYLDKTNEILYIGDNSGESVFDRILIEELDKPVKYVVRGIPIINDVTYEDALQAGIGKVAHILSSGTSAPGTVLRTCNPEFMKIYNNSNFIISKGQGNYEALSDERHPIFFLLMAKCSVIANEIGVVEGDIILKGV